MIGGFDGRVFLDKKANLSSHMKKYEAERSEEPDLQRFEMVTREERAGSALVHKGGLHQRSLFVVASDSTACALEVRVVSME
jgi:hypothetical protein